MGMTVWNLARVRRKLTWSALVRNSGSCSRMAHESSKVGASVVTYSINSGSFKRRMDLMTLANNLWSSSSRRLPEQMIVPLSSYLSLWSSVPPPSWNKRNIFFRLEQSSNARYINNSSRCSNDMFIVW